MGKRQDDAKARFRQGMIREAARSGISIREFCRRRNLELGQFYWWRRRLEQKREPGAAGKLEAAGRASLALVSERAGTTEAGIELVLGDVRRPATPGYRR